MDLVAIEVESCQSTMQVLHGISYTCWNTDLRVYREVEVLSVHYEPRSSL